MPVTYYVVVPFDRDGESNLKSGEAQEMQSPGAVGRRARAIATVHVRDPGTGEFQDASLKSRRASCLFWSSQHHHSEIMFMPSRGRSDPNCQTIEKLIDHHPGVTIWV